MISATRQLKFGFVAFLAVIVVSEIGYMLNGWSFLDSLYMVIITIFGVGYGEVTPVNTLWEKLTTMAVIVAGTASVLYIFSAFMRLMTEGQLLEIIGHRRWEKQMEELNKHTIICGYGRFGQTLARELKDSGQPFVVIDVNPEIATIAEEHGFLCHVGDASEEAELLEVGIDRAQSLATVLPADSLNVFITLTARNLNPNLYILSRGEQPSTEAKLKQAGADEVVLPAVIGGVRMAQNITHPGVVSYLKDSRDQVCHDLQHLGMRLEEFDVSSESSLIGHTLDEVENRSGSSHLVVAVCTAEGDVIRGDRHEYRLEPGDKLISVGHEGASSPEFE